MVTFGEFFPFNFRRRHILVVFFLGGARVGFSVGRKDGFLAGHGVGDAMGATVGVIMDIAVGGGNSIGGVGCPMGENPCGEMS